MMKALATVGLIAALAMTASGVSAEMLENFENGNIFSGGEVVADPEDAGNNVLFLDFSVIATLDFDAPLGPGESISMKVYDHGRSAMDEGGAPAGDSRPAGNIYGWNVGFSGTYNWGVSLVNKTFAGVNGGYCWTGAEFDSWPAFGGPIYSLEWFGGPRQVDSLSIIGTGTIADPEIPGDGAWATWVFTLELDGAVTLAIEDGRSKTSEPVESSMTRIFLASSSGALGQVWIDDVQIVGGDDPVCIPGDADCDGDVDLDDFVALKVGFGTGTTWAEGDFDGDGDVDLDDFVVLKTNFGATAG